MDSKSIVWNYNKPQAVRVCAIVKKDESFMRSKIKRTEIKRFTLEAL
uniref:Uncharacterized protein n=1 Tax=Glossina morsitans morsitans TaxID=37546 RepID=A0A1B0FPF6_GLOMM